MMNESEWLEKWPFAQVDVFYVYIVAICQTLCMYISTI